MADQNPPCAPFGFGESEAGPPQPDRSKLQTSRRGFLKTAGVGAAGMSITGAAVAEELEAKPGDNAAVSIDVTLNGEAASLSFDARTTLLDLLRQRLQLTGTKKGCDHGSCGACTVHVDGRRVLACLTLAATLDGATVDTIEGLAEADELHPMQSAFLRCDAYQCGYCTPGQIMSAVKCVEEGHAAGSVEQTREWMSGNLCRCGAYPNIVAAVRQQAGTDPESDPSEAVVVLSGTEANKMGTGPA